MTTSKFEFIISDRAKMVKAKVETTEPKVVSKRGAGLTADVKLSADLAAVIGASTMPRTQVVKKMWAIFKARGIQDPKDKRYIKLANQDDLKKIFPNVENERLYGFGLLKHLKSHMKTM